MLEAKWITAVVHVVPACPIIGMSLQIYTKRDMVAVGVAKGPPGICVVDAEK